MAARLPIWIFLSIAMLLIGAGLLPMLRVALGIDEDFAVQFFSVVTLLIGGLMCGLTAMILLVRRQPKLNHDHKINAIDVPIAKKMHLSGLLLYTGVPLLNFFVGYWLWLRHRNQSRFLDLHGQEMLNFQITIYLYLLLSLFLTYVAIGLLTTPLIFLLHFIITIVAIIRVNPSSFFSLPANIPIIQGRGSTNANE